MKSEDEGVRGGEDVEWREVKGEEARGGEEDKNDPIDRLYPGSRIDVHLSPASVISPTNHDVTSTGQYHTLQASSSRTLASLRLHAQHNRATAPSLNSSIWLLITGMHTTPESNSNFRLIHRVYLRLELAVGKDFAASGHYRLVHVAVRSKAD